MNYVAQTPEDSRPPSPAKGTKGNGVLAAKSTMLERLPGPLQNPYVFGLLAVIIVGGISAGIGIGASSGASAPGPVSSSSSPPPPPPPPLVMTYTGTFTTQTVAKAGAELIILNKYLTASPASSRWPIPCARSYEGNDWEVTLPRPPGDALVQIASCSASTCDIVIPDQDGYTYTFTTPTDGGVGALSSDARFDRSASSLLLQGTFGPTRSSIASLSTTMQGAATSSTPAPAPPAMAQWIVDQMAATPTLHRAYLRRRANNRLDAVSEAGRPRGACEVGARWNRIAIRGDDAGQTIRFTAVGSVTAMYVGGVLRSEIDLTEMRPYPGGLGSIATRSTDGTISMGVTLKICRVNEWRLGEVVIGSTCQSNLFPAADNRAVVFNVFINFSTLTSPSGLSDQYGDTIELMDLGSADAVVDSLLPTTIYNEGVRLLTQLNVACPLSIGAQLRPSTTMKYGGHYYLYDPRIVTRDNTVAAPADFSTSSGTAPLLCTSAPKTFLNEATCVRTYGCQSQSYSATSFTLDAATLREFFRSSRSFVYVIDGLRDDGSWTNPCQSGSALSRWKSLGAACSGTTVTGTMATTIAAAIRTSTDTNTFVKDLPSLSSSTCTNPGAGAQVDVDGTCWQHTHNNQLDVYDFTSWANAHNGNDEASHFYPIKAIAYATGTDAARTKINFPSSHGMSRWRAQGTQVREYRLGKFGDTLTFDDLPQGLQSAGFAAAVGVTTSPLSSSGAPPAVETCGSHGEVASDPALGNMFHFGSDRFSLVAAYTKMEMLDVGRRDDGNQKQQIHTMIALHAADQLRQRVAWSLSQVFVVGEGGSVLLSDSTEIWTAYYDIFVRNAFGSYRDVMREVAFSPMMATYLSFKGSESYAYSSTVADENFAREMMQLFSLGLWMLNDDGTQMSDAIGYAIPSYNQVDIVTQARLWTGFTQRDERGNIEVKRIATQNQLDPLLIRAERRDAFPKMNLYQRHIGDTYPLCSDLAPRAFLRSGATYRYLGTTDSADLSVSVDWSNVNWLTQSSTTVPPFAPDPSSSSLYAALTGSGFPQTVVLTSNLACHGTECDVDTARVIQILYGGTSYYFEYVPIACASLAFLNAGTGRYVDQFLTYATNNGLKERLCAEPSLPVASAGCCSPTVRWCFTFPCSYKEERMTYDTALQRCEAQWSSILPPPPPSPPSVSTTPTATELPWRVYPSAYRTNLANSSGCPAGSYSPTESECLEAAAIALRVAAEPHFDTLAGSMNPFAPSNSGIPPGCLIHTANAKALFNTHPTGGSSSTYKLVCHNAPVTGGNTGSALCPRKRFQCTALAADNCAVADNTADDSHDSYWWSEEACAVQVQVAGDGRVSVVHPGVETRSRTRRTEVNSQNWFRVRWANGAFPVASAGSCGAGTSCVVTTGQAGDTCVCDVGVVTAAAFTNAAALPSVAEIEEQLHIGAAPPSHYDSGTYALCATAACTSSSGVQLYTRGTASTPLFDENAIFVIVVNATTATNGRTLYLANKASTVTVTGSAHTFRNPPSLMTLIDPTQRDALYETEALLDHLFYHPNVAPFVAIRLIQRLAASNPSPRYVATASAAFRMGSYGGRTYTGQYGDIGAAVAAVLLDREARSLVLANDPTHGHLREPLLKLLHFMRAMEFNSTSQREVELSSNMIGKIGQQVSLHLPRHGAGSPRLPPTTLTTHHP